MSKPCLFCTVIAIKPSRGFLLIGHFGSPGLVDEVADDERREEEEAVAADGALRLNVDLMYRDDLPLGRGGLPHHLQAAR